MYTSDVTRLVHVITETQSQTRVVASRIAEKLVGNCQPIILLWRFVAARLARVLLALVSWDGKTIIRYQSWS
jgi:hypothetical protein